MPELGFGIMRFRGKISNSNNSYIAEVIDEYMKGDFCYFDLHPDYCEGMSQQIFYNFVSAKYDRSKYMVANKMPFYGIEKYEDYFTVFQQELKECGVEYFDYYLLHCINENNYQYHEKRNGMRFLKELKARNLVKKIGISFHGSADLLLSILKKYEFLDFVQLQINFVDWESTSIQSKECYDIAHKFKKEIIVMEPIKGGTISTTYIVDGKEYDPNKMAELSLRFINALDGVKIVLSGMTAVEHVVNNRKSVRMNPLPFPYYSKFIEQINRENSIRCTKCGYCKNVCNKKIDIPGILELVNEGIKISGEGISRMWMARLYYESNLAEPNRAGNCIECGMCERVCPQKLQIRNYIQIAIKMFDSADTYDVSKIVRTQVRFLYLSEMIQKELEKDKAYKVYVYGFGKAFEQNCNELLKYCNVVAAIDKDVNKHGTKIENVECVDLSTVPKDAFILIMVEDDLIVGQIIDELKSKGYFLFDYYWNWLFYMNDYLWS